MRLRSVSGLSLIPVLTSTALPAGAWASRVRSTPRVGAGGKRPKAVLCLLVPGGSQTLPGTPRHFDTSGVGSASPRGAEAGPVPTM